MERTDVAGGVVVNENGEVTLVKNGPSFWGFPKGHVDPGEDFLSTAKREVYEESGLNDLELVHAYPPYERYRGLPDGSGDDLAELKTIYMFLFRTRQTNLLPRDQHNPEARWVAPQDVESVLSHPKDKEFWREASIIPLSSPKQR